MTAPSVSVVVPTRDRPRTLRRCLAALARQTVDGVEIIVVDDASVDADAVAAEVAAVPGVRLLAGDGRGPAAARNAGARAARARVVCFTDDDCRPDPSWAGRLAARVDAGADAAAGPTRAPAGAGPVVRAAQLVASHLAEATADPTTGAMAFAPTSNLACRTDVARALPFDEDYPLAAGEDRDWCARLCQSGRRLVFVPDAVVHHHQALSLSGFWRQQVRYGRGGWRFHRSHGDFERLPWYASLLRAAFADGVRVGLLVCLAQLATAVGMAQQAAASRRVTTPG